MFPGLSYSTSSYLFTYYNYWESWYSLDFPPGKPCNRGSLLGCEDTTLTTRSKHPCGFPQRLPEFPRAVKPLTSVRYLHYYCTLSQTYHARTIVWGYMPNVRNPAPLRTQGYQRCALSVALHDVITDPLKFVPVCIIHEVLTNPFQPLLVRHDGYRPCCRSSTFSLFLCSLGGFLYEC